MSPSKKNKENIVEPSEFIFRSLEFNQVQILNSQRGDSSITKEEN